MITFGAGASSSLSKFDFPFQVQSNINSSSLPRNQFHLPRQFSSPNRRKSELYLSSSNSNLSSPYSSSTQGDSFKQSNIQLQVQTCIWNWKGYSIRYQLAGEDGPALVLIHGFGANSDHWRKNIKVLAESNRVFSIDLIGYGYSDKPNPREFGVNNTFYSFETWATQINDFCIHVVKSEAFFICNSIGGLVGLLAAVLKPDLCKGILLLNISLRMLHIKKQPWYGRPLIRSFQNLLRNTGLGKSFFKTVATADSVRDILRQCYHDDTQVTDELVEAILLPGLEPGAVDVFLEFICYSDGPLPEDLLPQVKCPVLVAWGDKDPWEPVQLGRAYGNFVSVENFVVIPNVGHCPQDEAPHLVNPLIRSFVARHSVDQPTRLSNNLLFDIQGQAEPERRDE